MSRGAFSGVGSIQISRSPVARGRRECARAYAPTIRNRASASRDTRKRSTKSGFIRGVRGELPLFHRQPPRQQDALPWWNLKPEFGIVAIGFEIRRETTPSDVPG